MFHPATELELHRPATIVLTFEDGEKKLYNLFHIIDKLEVFKELVNNPDLFSKGKLSPSGCAVVWSDEAGLSSDTIWAEGKLMAG